mmetsp:Transcript_23455/g.59893  ORF Transcript_23455/g.59893 Transcript_23455/m.59893 type:complete len:191 (-) Transcript_23455:338-910(-)
MQRLVCNRLARESIIAVQIGPGASQAQRARALERFSSDPEVSCFILSMKAAAVGLTLTCASRVVLLDPSLSLADEAQAIGRVHRFGQTKPVHVVKLVTKHTVEEKILAQIHGQRTQDSEDETTAAALGGVDAAMDGDTEGYEGAETEVEEEETPPVSSVASSSSLDPPQPRRDAVAQQALSVELLCRLLD